MIRNFITIAWRNIVRGKYYSLVNISGLAIGICFTMLIGSFVLHEYGVNKNLKNVDRQYILQSHWKSAALGIPLTTFGPLAKALKEQYPGLVDNYYRFDGISTIVSKGTTSFREELQIGDSTLLDMYGLPLVYGNSHTALDEPYTMVVTDKTAIRFFGRTDVLGRTLSIENFIGEKHDFTVTGVVGRLSENSVTHLTSKNPSGIYIANSNLAFFGRNMDWTNRWIVGYIELKKGVSAEDLTGPMIALVRKNVPEAIASHLLPQLVSLKSYYLTSNNGAGKKTVLALSLIALFILAMTVINFLNMTIARSSARTKEVGVRKVLGSPKRQIIFQFLLESIFVVYIAMAISSISYGLIAAPFGHYLNFQMTALNSLPGYYIILPLLFPLILGVIAGIYPAFLLAGLKSTDAMKKRLNSVKGKGRLRSSLIAFQFISAAVAFIAAIIITKQIHLFLGKDLGYNKDFVVTAQVPRDWTRTGLAKMEDIGQQFKTINGVQDISLSYEIPTGNSGGQGTVYKMSQDPSEAIAGELLNLDGNFCRVYQIPVIAGKYFDLYQRDSDGIVLNETATRALGWKDPAQAVGAQIRMPGDPTVFTVKGIIADFHFGTMKQEIPPLIMQDIHRTSAYRYLSFRLSGSHIASTLNAVQQKWQQLMPGSTFEYNFMDDTLKSLYQAEMQLKKATYLGASLAIMIVLLGIFGLVSLSVHSRTKEVGVRKILGASSMQIILLFLKEFSSMLIISILVACPLGYLLMRHWLSSYAYRVPITCWPFAWTFGVLIFLTCLLTALKTANTARANPVSSLRTE